MFTPLLLDLLGLLSLRVGATAEQSQEIRRTREAQECRRANVTPRHGVPVAHGQEPVEAHQVDGDAHVAQVGQPEGPEVAADDPELRGRVEDGDAEQEKEPVRVPQLERDEPRVVRVRNGRRGRDLLLDEPVRRYEGRDGPGDPVWLEVS